MSVSFLSTSSFAQNGTVNNSDSANNVVALTPDIGQGYLVLNKLSNPNVNYWVLTISKQIANADGSIASQTVQQVNLPSGRNYWKVPAAYKNNTSSVHYQFSVIGYDANNTAVASETATNLYTQDVPALVGGGTSYSKTCTWKCNGVGYAWVIEQFSNMPNNTSSDFQLETGYDYIDTIITSPNYGNVIPYYEYFNGVHALNIFCNTHPNECPHGNVPDGINVVGPLNGNTANYCHDDGNVIRGDSVYGIAKTLGPWLGSAISTPHYSINSFCNKQIRPINWAITEINIHGDFTNGNVTYPPVTCDPATCVHSFSNTTVSNKPKPDTVLVPLPSGATDTLVFLVGRPPIIKDTSFSSVLLMLESYLSNQNIFAASHNANGNDTTPFPFIDRVILTNLNDRSQAPVIIDSSGSVDITAQNVDSVLAPGLWCIGIAFKDGKYLPIIRENSTNISFPRPNESNHLSVSIHPVPIKVNHFHLKLQSDIDMVVNYTLFDFNGNLLYQKQFDLTANHPSNSEIFPENDIPSGLLFNRFTFEDGSVKTIETNKQ